MISTADAAGLNPEIVLAALAVLTAAAARGRWRKALGCWERPLARLARRRRAAVMVSALLPVVLRLALLPWHPPPEPRLHDEFSFLLGADTLANGRLANPPHPHWVHFESMHILARPVYASAFPPGQAAVLALGKIVTGHAWAGVVASVGLMCGAVCWMLQGWFPPRWALLGALLFGLRTGVASYWMNSYWGGALSAAGGALVLGALPRMVRAPRLRWAGIMGVGFAVLAFSRTVEGAVLGVIAAVALGVRMPGEQGPNRGAALRKAALSLAGVAALVAAANLAYFKAVTGATFVPPYVLYRSNLTMAPHFVWQPPRPEPLYNNHEMRHFYAGIEMDRYRQARVLWPDIVEKAASYWRFYVGPLFAIPFFAVPLLWRRRDGRLILMAGAAFSLVLAIQVWHNQHYGAPATALGVAAMVLGMRALAARRRIGLSFVRTLPVLCVLALCIRAEADPAEPGGTGSGGWRWPAAEGQKRATVLRRLAGAGGRHLVLVRYSPLHDPGDEWVYNDADIDNSPVVWARELDPASNAKLTAYFADRRVWLLEPDAPDARIIAYRGAEVRPMEFVRPGAPGIDAIRDPEQVRRRVLSSAGDTHPLACDAWNWHFTRVTGVQGPDVAKGCYPGSERSRLVEFDRWWAWLLDQRE